MKEEKKVELQKQKLRDNKVSNTVDSTQILKYLFTKTILIFDIFSV